eukprot:4428778-Amphidinium_carterae.1
MELGDQVSALPQAVRRELRWCASLICMARRDLGAAWESKVHMCDASPYGFGIVETNLALKDVASMGSYNERWRFSVAQEHDVGVSARDHAFSYQEPQCVREAYSRGEFPEVPERVLKADWKPA